MRDPAIKIRDCIRGRLYRFKARNFQLGVFDGVGGFVGIRTKFGSQFLDVEYHWEFEDRGTVYGIEDTHIQCPARIEPKDTLGSYDTVTNRPVAFDRPVKEGGRGWYFTDTNEECDEKVRPSMRGNEELYQWLQKALVQVR